MDTEIFTTKARLIHGNKYDYTVSKYINARTKIDIICKEHGLFKQLPNIHLNNHGCVSCGRLNNIKSITSNTNKFIYKAQLIHNNEYDYTNVKYNDVHTKVEIICKDHGLFYQTPYHHLKGHGCSKCAINRNKDKNNSSTSEFIKKANLIFNNKYDYSYVQYVDAITKVEIICKDHGLFYQTPHNHLKGCGCKKCGIISTINKNTRNTNYFIDKAQNVHDNKYDYSKVLYSTTHEKVEIICKDHGPFSQTPHNHTQGCGCPKCKTAHIQLEIYNFVKQYAHCDFNNRTAIKPYELDIFIPSLMLGIEINGIYWHSYNRIETTKEKNKHYIKYKECLDKNIKLLQFTDYELENKREIVKSIILNKLGKSTRFYARKCKIYIPSKEECMNFLNSNHIQGSKGYSYAVGLKFDDELVELMTFSKHNKYEWEIARLATKLNYNIIGGASKLFKKFIIDNKPNLVMTYADLRFGSGDVYKKLGFSFIKHTQPNYCYVKQKNIYSRQKFQKHKLKNRISNFNHDLTESQNMFNNKYRRLWDAGHNKYLYGK